MNKVYVVVDEFYGTIADVNVYKNEPKNLKTISEDEGQRCFELEIKDSNNEWRNDNDLAQLLWMSKMWIYLARSMGLPSGWWLP